MAIKWQQFVQTREGASVKKFFLKLNTEIAQTTADTDKPDAALLLNTKKGYWLYKIFEREEADAINPIKVFSDRFVKKMTNCSPLQGKIIYLVDDTLTNGYSLYATYELLSEYLEEVIIYPVVFALNETVDLQNQINNSTGKKAEFWKNLKYFIRLSEEDMGLFCMRETKLMHNENIPYVIDLPYLQNEQLKSKVNYEITLTQEQFVALQQDSEMWKFHFNSYKLDYDIDDELLRGFIIQMQDEQLIEATKKYFTDYVITGTYTMDEDGNINIVFVPFAVANSIDIEALEKLWNNLIGNKSVKAVEKNNLENESLWIKRYRESVYVMSMEIAERFMTHLKVLTGIKLCYDYHILEEHFPIESIRRIKAIEEERKIDPDRICGIFTKVYNHISLDEKPEKEVYSEIKAFDMIDDEMRKRKVNFLTSDTHNKQEAVLELEEFHKMLGERFYFQTNMEFRYAIARIVVTLLQTSICSSQLFVSQKKLIKGVRYGENSDLALTFLDLNYYWAVILWVEKMGKDKALNLYEHFAEGLENIYKNLGLFGDEIAKEKFNKNKRYFMTVLENGFQLYNKYFYFNPIFKGKRKKTEVYYMDKIEEYVTNIQY